MTSRLTWFTSPKGRRIIGGIAATTTCGTFAISFIPNTLFLYKYKEFMELRKLNKPIGIQPHVRKLWDTVLDDLNLNDHRKKKIEPFTIFGFDPWYAGSIRSKFGAIIGLPINLICDDTEKIEKDKILINNEPIDWSRDDAKQFLDGITLSDKAKKYVMAREILMTNNSHMYIRTISTSAIIGTTYIFAVQMNQSFKMFEKPRALRVILYLFTAVFSYGLWAMQHDMFIRHYEHQADQQASELGTDYIEGAIEFYDKMLKRNIAQRSLFGSFGEKTYTAGGNKTYFLRMKNLPLTHRKKFFEDKLKAQGSTTVNE